MSVTITGSGGLFTRLGSVLGALNDMNSFRGGTATTDVISAGQLPTRYAAFVTAYTAGTSLMTTLDGFNTQITQAQAALSTYASSLQTLSQSTLVNQVNADVTLPVKSVAAAMAQLLIQVAGNYNVTASTLSTGSQTSVGSPVGTPIIVGTTLDGKGYGLDYAFAETFTFATTADANGTATAGNEPVLVTGKAAVSDSLSYLWPGGSGTSKSINVVNAEADNSEGNTLVNSDFETWSTTNYPDNWTIATGAATTNVLRSSTAYTGDYSLRFLGDAGGTLTAVTQEFNKAVSTIAGAGGTPFTLSERTPMAVSLYTAVSSVPGAGVLRVALVDGSGTVVNDDAGTANSFTITLTGETTSFANHTGVFRTPTNLPDPCYLQLKLTTAISNTVSVFIDHLAVSEMTQMYTGGPFFSIFSSDTNTLVGDSWTMAFNNNMSSTTWQGCLQKIFDMRSLGMRFPTTGGSTINANLIA